MYFPFICGISIFPVFFYWCFFYVFLYITHPCSTRGGVEREWGLVVTELQQVHLILLISPVGVDLSWYEFSQSLSGQRQTLYKNTCNHTNTTQKCMCQDHHHTSKYKKNFSKSVYRYMTGIPLHVLKFFNLSTVFVQAYSENITQLKLIIKSCFSWSLKIGQVNQQGFVSEN